MDKTLPPINEDLRIVHMRRERMKIAKWLETKRGRPQYRPAPPAGRAVAKVLKPLSKKFTGSSSAARLIPHWPSIIGEKWAKFSRPEKFSADKTGKILIISAPGPAAALITASAGPILDRVNIYMGEGVVTGLRVQQKKMGAAARPRSNMGDKAGTNQNPKNPTGQYLADAPRNSGRPAPRGLTPQEETILQEGLEHVEHNALKSALAALGRNVIAQGSDDTS